MLDTTKPLAYFDADENLLALTDISDPEMTRERSDGEWIPMAEGSENLLDGAEIATMNEAVIPVLDKADADDTELTRTDLEQYIIPMELGNE